MNDINSDVECNETCNCCNTFKLTRNLFRKVNASSRLKGDDIYITIEKEQFKLYGITVNILPFKSMNKKRWFTYSHDKQREILARIESRFRKDNPSVKLKEIHYELCPSTDKFHNIHFHALYKMPVIFKAELETYYNRICLDKSNKNWRHLDIKEINNVDQWLKYIRKDAKNEDESGEISS